jgi:hypothetical protein
MGSSKDEDYVLISKTLRHNHNFEKWYPAMKSNNDRPNIEANMAIAA